MSSVLRQLDQCLRVARGACFVAGVCAAALCALCLLGIGGVHAEESADDGMKVRIILSTGALTDINVNDATAAFRFWLRELGNADVNVVTDAVILSSVDEITREMEKYPNHLVSLSLPEYLSFDADRFSRNIYLAEGERVVGNRYLVLIHESRSIQTLGELRGKSLVQYDHRETMMAQDWLNYQLVDAGHVSAEALLSSYTKNANLSKTVLGVFFGKVDACIVSNQSFDLLCELNPQLRLKLKVLARSPEIVCGAMFTQSNYDPDLEVLVGESLEALGEDISGKQLLTVFRADSVYRADLSELQNSIDLYSKWTSVKGEGE